MDSTPTPADVHPNVPGEAPPLVPHEPMPMWWRGAILAGVALLTLFVWLGGDSLGARPRAVCGVVCFIALIAAFSTNLRAVNWRTVGLGFALQVALAVFILKSPWGFKLFQVLGEVIRKFLDFAGVGAKFVFGPLADPALMKEVFPGNSFVFACMALPTIIFVSSFFTVLYHFGILQFVVRIMSRAMMYLLKTSGAETLSAVANVFMGQTEAPLIVKPYVNSMTRSELLALMVGGMATISGGVMAIYIAMGADPVAILATSVMAAPCGLYLSKLLVPETHHSATAGTAEVKVERLHSSAVDAAAAGASDGMSLAINVAAMLIAFLAFIAFFDAVLGLISPDLSLSVIFSKVFAPVALLMGADRADVPMIADLLGIKLVANEFISYTKLTSPATALDPGYAGLITQRGAILATYALTGFANISSIGIQLGGIGGMAPMRRSDLASLTGRALLAGFVATLINASIAGMFIAD